MSGLAAATLPAGHALGWAWILAPIAAIAVLVVGGPRRFLLQFCLDLVGVLRLVAVAGAALLVLPAPRPNAPTMADTVPAASSWNALDETTTSGLARSIFEAMRAACSS